MPSFSLLSSVADSLRKIWKRFPLVMIDTALMAIIGIVFLSFEGLDRNKSLMDILAHLLMGLILVAPLLATAVLLAERIVLSVWKKRVLQGVILFAVGLYALLLSIHTFPLMDAIRYSLFLFGAAILLLIIPAGSVKESIDHTWTFVFLVLRRFFFAVLFAGLLFGGVALMLGAIDFLWSVEFKEYRYPQVWIFFASIVAPWIFLAGIPRLPDVISKKNEYPPVLKLILVYGLLPIVGLFFVILYAYLATILFSWSWPIGGVVQWIVFVSIFTFLTFALAHPFLETHAPIRRLLRWMFILLFPLTVVYFIALFMRITEYGLTVNRAFLVLYGMWMLLVAGYCLWKPRPSLSLIAGSFVIISFVFSIGPQSVFAFTYRDQTKRLDTILSNGLEKNCHQFNTILRYLKRMYGNESIKRYEERIQAEECSISTRLPRQISRVSLQAKEPYAIPVDASSFVFPFQLGQVEQSVQYQSGGEEDFFIATVSDNHLLVRQKGILIADFDLNELTPFISEESPILLDPELLQLNSKNGLVDGHTFLSSVSFKRQENSTWNVRSLKGIIVLEKESTKE